MRTASARDPPAHRGHGGPRRITSDAALCCQCGFPHWQHHLGLAGRSDTLFSDDAVGLIHEASRGLPRLINNLAIASLIAAFTAEKGIVDESAVRVAVAENSAE
jgi:hypothetical protein